MFVQALEAETQHIGHEYLASVLRKAKAALKSRLIQAEPRAPPKPPPRRSLKSAKQVCELIVK